MEDWTREDQNYIEEVMNTEPRPPVLCQDPLIERENHEDVMRILTSFNVLPVKLDVITPAGISPYTGDLPYKTDGKVYHVRYVGRCTPMFTRMGARNDESGAESTTFKSRDFFLLIPTVHEAGFWWVTGVYGHRSYIKMQ